MNVALLSSLHEFRLHLSGGGVEDKRMWSWIVMVVWSFQGRARCLSSEASTSAELLRHIPECSITNMFLSDKTAELRFV